MGDFLLDFRPKVERRITPVAASMKFVAHSKVCTFEEPEFSLALSFTGSEEIWGTFRSSDGVFVAIAGRVALDAAEWGEAAEDQKKGGLASKGVYHVYRRHGVNGIEQLSGNCAVLVYDSRVGSFHIVVDPFGAFPVFQWNREAFPVFASHPDILASAVNANQDLDEVSLTEFLLTSTVTPPFTYYRSIRAVPCGTTITVSLAGGQPGLKAKPAANLSLIPDCNQGLDDLAEELAQAFRSAVRRRTLPHLGRTAVALSGGLDSRALLACIEDKDQVFAFCCYNEPNRELATAEAIAKALEVPFHPWQRDFEYYGRNAEAGVRISGGMGTFANNHFLGVLDRLQEQGAENLLTGCYCDYLFKGLPLNRRTNWLTGREQLAPFKHEFYFSHNLRPSPLRAQVLERLEARVPARFQAQKTPADVFQVEAHRTFPLCYEGDNQQRVVPQRVTGWYLPMADRDILNVYRKIPWHMKLNRSVYSKAVGRLCHGPLAAVPDANTGARVGASALSEALHHHWSRVKRKLRRSSRTIATDGSWPNWPAYVERSPALSAMWKRSVPQADDFFRRNLSPGDVRPETTDYRGDDIWLLIPMLTLKLWFEQWHS